MPRRTSALSRPSPTEGNLDLLKMEQVSRTEPQAWGDSPSRAWRQRGTVAGRFWRKRGRVLPGTWPPPPVPSRLPTGPRRPFPEQGRAGCGISLLPGQCQARALDARPRIPCELFSQGLVRRLRRSARFRSLSLPPGNLLALQRPDRLLAPWPRGSPWRFLAEKRRQTEEHRAPRWGLGAGPCGPARGPSLCPWSRPSLNALPPASVRGKGASC
ncbi:unnamed protein product [Rangifer tarandus platyrhynchus]|uniref:Uncharacterized protein n=1 Tax=Rangifer tarandus platyrhynchus TaxID=3082113 RepID=A0AC59YGD0_RANTA